jgi:hypothetical protein
MSIVVSSVFFTRMESIKLPRIIFISDKLDEVVMAFNRWLVELCARETVPVKSTRGIIESLKVAVTWVKTNPLLTSNTAPHGDFFRSSCSLLNHWIENGLTNADPTATRLANRVVTTSYDAFGDKSRLINLNALSKSILNGLKGWLRLKERKAHTARQLHLAKKDRTAQRLNYATGAAQIPAGDFLFHELQAQFPGPKCKWPG